MKYLILFCIFMVVAPIKGWAQDSVVAVVQGADGASQTTETVDLSSTSALAGPFVPASSSGIGASSLVVYNWNPKTQLNSFAAEVVAGGALIVAQGDSTTVGFGATSQEVGYRELGYPAELAQYLTAAGFSAEQDGWLGQGFYGNIYNADLRVSLIGDSAWSAPSAGGSMIQTKNAGDGAEFTSNWPSNYNRVVISYLDSGTGSFGVSVDGGPTIGNVTLTNTDFIRNDVVVLPAGMHSSFKILQTGSAPVLFQGGYFSRPASKSLRVLNAGIGGWTSTSSISNYCTGGVTKTLGCGAGQTAGVMRVAGGKALVILNLWINDYLTNIPLATTVSNLRKIIVVLKAHKNSVILETPNPFCGPTETDIQAMRTAFEKLAVQENVPLFDLEATYGDSCTALRAAGLLADEATHPNATLYSALASQISKQIVSGLAANGVY